MPLDLVQILKNQSGSVEQIGGLDRAVWDAIERTGTRRWHKSDPIPGSGRRLLIGISTYSFVDLQLAQELIDQAANAQGLVVDFFSVLDIKNMADFEEYVPGVGNVYHTPVVGFWVDGRFQRAAHGPEGRILAQLVAAGGT